MCKHWTLQWMAKSSNLLYRGSPCDADIVYTPKMLSPVSVKVKFVSCYRQCKLEVSVDITANQIRTANQIIAGAGLMIHLFTQTPSGSGNLDSHFVDYRVCFNHSLRLQNSQV